MSETKFKREKKYGWFLRTVHEFFVVFLLVSAVVTCSIVPFVSIMSKNLDIVLSEDDVAVAAKMTFLIVIFISVVFTVVDILRRRITVALPAKQIKNAAAQMMRGDFNVRIPAPNRIFSDENFIDIIECFNTVAEELSKTEILRADFIADVSHELKTPLAVIQNYATMLRSPALTDKERDEYSKVIADAASRLATLVSNILKLNKLDNQKMLSPAVSEYDLGEQLCECLLGFESEWEKKGLEIETDIEDGVLVRTDADMMSIVWNNLFSNAIKFTDSGSVSLSLHSDGEFATVRVADTGCGMSKEVGERMFEKFYQGDSSHSTLGNGLGLALVKRIIELTESDISVETTLGKGTVFTVRLRRNTNETV